MRIKAIARSLRVVVLEELRRLRVVQPDEDHRVAAGGHHAPGQSDDGAVVAADAQGVAQTKAGGDVGHGLVVPPRDASAGQRCRVYGAHKNVRETGGRPPRHDGLEDRILRGEVLEERPQCHAHVPGNRGGRELARIVPRGKTRDRVDRGSAPFVGGEISGTSVHDSPGQQLVTLPRATFGPVKPPPEIASEHAAA